MKFKINLANIFSLFLLSISLFVWRGYYEQPKVFLLYIVGISLTLFWIYKIVFKKQIIVLDTPDYFYLLWILTTVISSIFGVHPWESIIGGSYRHQGVIFFFTLWLIYKTVELFDNQQKSFLGKGVGAVVLIEALISFIKPLGTIGETNAVAGFLAIGSYFVLQYLPKIYLIVPFIAILITKSRAGLLSIFPIMVLIKQKLLMFLAIVLIIVISWQHISSPFENRPLIWRLGIESVLSKPILGYGAESGEVVFNNAFSQANIPLRDLIIDRSHNLFLDVLIWSGGIGLLFFGAFLIFRFKALKNKYQKLGFVAFLIYSMFQPLSIVHWLLVFLM